MSKGRKNVSQPTLENSESGDGTPDSPPRRRRLRRSAPDLLNNEDEGGSQTQNDNESNDPSSNEESSLDDLSSSSDEDDRLGESQNSFSLDANPIASPQRQRRLHRRRRNYNQNTQNNQSSQTAINCVKLTYTDIVRSASDFLQDLFGVVSDHDRHFFQQSAPDHFGTPARPQHPNEELTRQHGSRSVPISADDSAHSHLDPWTGDWMTEKRSMTQTTPAPIDEPLNHLPTQKARPNSRFITVFAAPDPDSVCTVSLLKVCTIRFFHFIDNFLILCLGKYLLQICG